MPRALLTILFMTLLVAGCGDRKFEPDEFVDVANAEGAGLVLGESLTSITEDVEVFSVSFEEGEEPGSGGEHEHGSGGSLLVTSDSETATEEFERCEAAVSLTCYRAANVVLYFNAPPNDEHVAKADSAIRALASE